MNQAAKKILIVDDEPDILEFLAYNLKKEGYLVSTAANGKAGIEMAMELQPDLIILDIMMPELDGIEVCRQLRQNEQFQETLIAFLTARAEDYTQIAALDYGGDDYITKPIKPGVLISRIKALFRRSAISQETPETGNIQVGDFSIDREKFQVVRQGKVIELAKKEFNLIELLASKPGKVFTRDEIFRKVWGADVIVGDRTIDVHIRKLREKLGEDLIKTVKGIGYKFEF
jgi:two-component system, OmpR family, alkaline phosphatase synthesis response regulator PhoP